LRPSTFSSGQRVDDQRRDAGVVEDVGVVVERAQRMQRGAPGAQHLARADDQQHLGPVGRQQRGGLTGAGACRLERLCVLADLGGRLRTGQRGVSQYHHRLVAMTFQRGDGQMTKVVGKPHRVSHFQSSPFRSFRARE